MSTTVSFGGVTIRNTRELINENTRLCALLYAPPKLGKTTVCATLDALTRKYFGKPTLFIAVEAGEGGGTMTIKDYGVDYVAPENWQQLSGVLAALASDTRYAGVVLDSATEYVKRFLQPQALAQPLLTKTSPRRAQGVPERQDYQTMGEQARIHFNQLINLTTHPNLNVRKHLLVTATQRSKEDDEGTVIAITPELPGAMSQAATALFQTVATLMIKHDVVRDPTNPTKTIRVARRVLVTDADGVRILGDRTKIFPKEGPPDLLEIWEKYWIPAITVSKQPAEAAAA